MLGVIYIPLSGGHTNALQGADALLDTGLYKVWIVDNV
jgi:hypothetical protein